MAGPPYLDEAIGLFAERSDVMFAQHHWPRWGTGQVVDFLDRRGAPARDADATVSVARSVLDEVLAGAATIDELLQSGRLSVEGDPGKLAELLGLLDPPDPSFAIVTP